MGGAGGGGRTAKTMYLNLYPSDNLTLLLHEEGATKAPDSIDTPDSV